MYLLIKIHIKIDTFMKSESVHFYVQSQTAHKFYNPAIHPRLCGRSFSSYSVVLPSLSIRNKSLGFCLASSDGRIPLDLNILLYNSRSRTVFPPSVTRFLGYSLLQAKKNTCLLLPRKDDVSLK